MESNSCHKRATYRQAILEQGRILAGSKRFALTPERPFYRMVAELMHTLAHRQMVVVRIRKEFLVQLPAVEELFEGERMHMESNIRSINTPMRATRTQCKQNTCNYTTVVPQRRANQEETEFVFVIPLLERPCRRVHPNI